MINAALRTERERLERIDSTPETCTSAFPTLEARLSVRLTRGGELLPWIGPALRGLVCRQLKSTVCLHPPAERDAKWLYCKGCPYSGDCAYARVFEPPVTAAGAESSGQADGCRPVVITPCFPMPQRVAAGQVIPLSILLVSHRAVTCFAPLVAALADAGRSPGIGPDRVTFELPGRVDPLPVPRWFRGADLPLSITAGQGRVPRAVVELVAPLFLSCRDHRGRRQKVRYPTLGDLLRASLRTIGRFFRECAHPLPADFAGLKAAAEKVVMIEHDYSPFRQRRWSHRTQQRYEMEGVIGWGAYQDVPLALLPWLAWGGRLHVGTHRVAGAGGWQVILD